MTQVETVTVQDKEGQQLLAIPEALRIADDKVYLKKVGNILYVIPYHAPWQSLFESLDLFSEDFMEERQQPLSQHRQFFEE